MLIWNPRMDFSGRILDVQGEITGKNKLTPYL